MFAIQLMDLMFDTLRVRDRDDPSPHATGREAAIAALGSMNARDPVDLMFAAHAVASHHATMECFRRAMLTVNDPDAASRMHRSAMGLSRMMADTVKHLPAAERRFWWQDPMHREDSPAALGRLRNGNPSTSPSRRTALRRAQPRRPAVPSAGDGDGRCRNHGGESTGPTTWRAARVPRAPCTAATVPGVERFRAAVAERRGGDCA